jgi:3-phosphoshikimate 1-carboxyvinyltransferase
MIATVFPGKLNGAQVAPASKSSMQRACAAALLHVGETTILNPGHSIRRNG